jgi:hypothetical protein
LLAHLKNEVENIMPLEVALAFDQDRREAQDCDADDTSQFHPSEYSVILAPYFSGWWLASHPDYPENPCGQGLTPEAAIEDWSLNKLCHCGMVCAEACNCSERPF